MCCCPSCLRPRPPAHTQSMPLSPPLRFAVTVAKEEGYLSFECQSNGQIVTINHMGLEDIVEEAEEDEEEEAPPLYK